MGKKSSWIDMAVLEKSIRDDLDPKAPRMMCVLNPVKLIIDNYPEDTIEMMEAQNHPKNPEMGTRQLPFGRELYIERDDFMEDPPKKFHRLGPGREVRLRYGYLVTCVSYEKDETTGEITTIHCTYDPATRGGSAPDGRKVKGTIHWVSAEKGVDCPVRLYDRLFTAEFPDAEKGVDFKDYLNPHSKVVLEHAKAEPALAQLEPGKQVQFERTGYFCADYVESQAGKPVFNRIVTLKDSWAKEQDRS
jgi:glutaminyl-tRNA synthetase